MNGLERLILDLVEIAEAPLYSTYRWLGRQLGEEVSIVGFLRAIDALVQRGVLQLWVADSDSGDRTELFEVPANTESRYLSEPELDARYDPSGLSLTLGRSDEVGGDPDWELRLDFERGVFEIEIRMDSESEALEQLARSFPDTRARVTHRTGLSQRHRVFGTLSRHPASDGRH